jgi:siroheme synthase-like protein
MRYLPVMLDVAGRRVLVVGGGATATQKASRLLAAGARLRVVAPVITADLVALTDGRSDVEFHRRDFREGDLDGVVLVFSATGVREVERAVRDAAERAGLWVNAVDDPEHCSFLMPATLARGPLEIAVSTGGASPALARRVRDEIGASLGPEYGAAAEILGELRRDLPPGEARQRAFQRLLDGGLLEALRQGDGARVDRMTEEARRRAAEIGGEREA